MNNYRIDRRDFLKISGLTLLGVSAGLFSSGGVSGKSSKKAPNIILIDFDDLGWTDTSVQMMAGRADSKDDYYKTKVMERLAWEGMTFSNAYAGAPLCSPSRHCILTGKTPARLRYTGNFIIDHVDAKEHKSVAQLIKEANPNYATAHFGKWHMGPSPKQWGFDEDDGEMGNGDGIRIYLSGNAKSRTKAKRPFYIHEGQEPLPEDDPKRIFSTTNKSIDFIKRQAEAGRPFYLQVDHFAVHDWYFALKDTLEEYKNCIQGRKVQDMDFLSEDELTERDKVVNWIPLYAAMIDDVDRSAGMILETLDELGLSDNTYVIFTGDNGGNFRGNNHPLRSHKFRVWEGGIRVPFIIRGPRIKRNSRCDIPIIFCDFLPTFVELTGGSKELLPEDIDGGSLCKLFFNGNNGKVKRPTDCLVWHYPCELEPQSAIRVNDYKLVIDWKTYECELFDLSKDLREKNNLAASQPEKAKELREKLFAYLRSVNAETAEYCVETQMNQGWIPQRDDFKKRLENAQKSDDPKEKQQIEFYKSRVKNLSELVQRYADNLEQIRASRKKHNSTF